MEAYGPLVNAALLAVFTLVITWVVRGQMTSLRQEVERRLDHVERRLDRIETELVQLRRDFNQLVLALGPRAQPQTG